MKILFSLFTKHKLLIFVLFVIAFFVSLKSYYSFYTFQECNFPIFDGVMNEFKQLERYQKFNGDFGLLNRFNQMIYEYKGNILSPGYTSLMTFFFPDFLITDWDIVLRSFFSVFIFSLSFYFLFKKIITPKTIILILVLIFQLPVFYHYRYGLSTYMPELSSALYMMSGLIFMLLYIRQKNIWALCISAIFLFIAISFRMIFIVYTFLILSIFIKKLWKNFAKSTFKNRLFQLLVVSCFMILLAIYFYPKSVPFFGYYLVDVPYESTSYFSSFSSLISYLTDQVGLVGLISLFFIFILVNQQGEIRSKENWFYIYPSLIYFLFIYVYNKSTNVPHVTAVFTCLLIFVFFSKSNLLKTIKISSRNKLTVTICLFIISSINYSFDVIRTSKTEQQYIVPQKISSEISKNNCSDYLIFYDENQSIPTSVASFRKDHKLNLHTRNFLFHDLFLYQISKTLNIDTCANYYIEMIKNNDIQLLAINQNENKANKFFPKVIQITRIIRASIQTNKRYYLYKTYSSKYHGIVELYKLIN